MTMRDDLEDLLIAWGRIYGKGREYMEDRSPTGNSNLARIIGKPKKGSTVGRAGYERRAFMARSLGGCGIRMVSASYVDPVRGVQTRSFKADSDPRETSAMTYVQNAWLDLYRVSESDATALRLHYQRRDMSREQKAKELTMTVRDYRAALARAKSFVSYKLEDLMCAA